MRPTEGSLYNRFRIEGILGVIFFLGGGRCEDILYRENRPKSENWAILTRRSSTTVHRTKKLTDLGNSLALGLQRGVNILCAVHPVPAQSEEPV